MQYLDSNQEEADTKLLLHVVDATAALQVFMRGAEPM